METTKELFKEFVELDYPYDNPNTRATHHNEEYITVLLELYEHYYSDFKRLQKEIKTELENKTNEYRLHRLYYLIANYIIDNNYKYSKLSNYNERVEENLKDKDLFKVFDEQFNILDKKLKFKLSNEEVLEVYEDYWFPDEYRPIYLPGYTIEELIEINKKNINLK